MHSRTITSLLLMAALGATVPTASGQFRRGNKVKKEKKTASQPSANRNPERYSGDIAFTFVEEHTDFMNQGRNNWIKGGSLDVGISAWHGLGLGSNITAEHSPHAVQSIDGDGTWYDLGKFSFAAGPRYTVDVTRYVNKVSRGRSVRFFGQYLWGVTHAFNTYIPYTDLRYMNSTNPFETTNNSMSMEGGGGIDVHAWKNIYIRPIQGSWTRQHAPDGRHNVQEGVRLSAGIMFHFHPND